MSEEDEAVLAAIAAEEAAEAATLADMTAQRDAVQAEYDAYRLRRMLRVV